MSYNGIKAENDRKIEQDYGFGTTQKIVNGRGENMEGVFNIKNAPETDAKRGLLYFTKKLLESTHGKHLAGDNIDFVVSTNNVAVANVTVCLLLESVLTG